MRTSLEEWGFESDSPLVYDALLVTNELLTNSLKACIRDVELEVGGHRDQLEICVADDGTGSAEVVDRGPHAESGRGLRIIEAVCADWGQSTPDSTGKRVWCHLALDSVPSSFSDRCNRR